MDNIVGSNIIDIKIFEGRVHVDKLINLKLVDFEAQLKKIYYEGQNLIRIEYIEKYKFPPFILGFYGYLAEYCKIPTGDEFFDYYVYKNLEKVYSEFSNEYKAGTHARALRSYPSFIRDFHFYLLCYESNLFDKVEYSLNKDYYKGIDISITHKGKKFAISLFVKTARGKDFKEKKKEIHDYADVIEIAVEVDLHKSCKKISNFILCDNSILEFVSKKIEGFLLKKLDYEEK
jgi:hypothetical protein